MGRCRQAGEEHQGGLEGGLEVVHALALAAQPVAVVASPLPALDPPPPHLFLLKCHQKLGLRVSMMLSWMKQVRPRYMHAMVWPCTAQGVGGNTTEVRQGARIQGEAAWNSRSPTYSCQHQQAQHLSSPSAPAPPPSRL